MAAHAEGLADGATAPAPAETAFWRSTMARLLPYEQTLVGELIEEDALCILAAGLGWQRMVAVIIRLHHYHQAGVLLVLGAQPWQREAVCFELQRHDPEVTCPVDINSEVQAPERLALYRSRAAAFVTPRILTVDLLSARLQPREIAGMIVLNAHRVTATSGEGFAVRLYRAGNSSGFLRALSDAPAAFMGGFNKVEKVMRALHVRRLRLWPRFQQEVQAAMEASPPQVEECLQELPASVQLIQAAILEVIESLLKELRRANKVDCSELTLESLALHKAFDDVVRRQLDPVWHTLSWRSRQIVKDLKTLRAIAQYLIQYDAVTFLAFLEGLRLSEGARSVWLFHDAAHTMFDQARRRVYKYQQQRGPTAAAASAAAAAAAAAGLKSSAGPPGGGVGEEQGATRVGAGGLEGDRGGRQGKQAGKGGI